MLQAWERAIPRTAVDTNRVDITAETRSRHLPAEMIPVMGRVGGALNEAFARLDVAKPEPEMGNFANMVRDHCAEIVGITPPIFGAGPTDQTAYAANLKRNQALLQLSLYADSGRDYWCDVTYNAVIQTARHSQGRIPSPYSPNDEVDTIDDIEDLLKGGYHFEGSDEMPMSWSERRQNINEVIKNSAGDPQLRHNLGLDKPSNIGAFQELMMAIPNWTLPDEDAYDKVMDCILQLLQGQATQQPSQLTPGQTISVPSIPADEFDDHAFFAQAISDWLQTEQAREIRVSNPSGFNNVCAFWKAHKGLSMPPPPPVGGPIPSVGAKPNGLPAPPGGPPKQLMPPPGGAAQATPGQPPPGSPPALPTQ
jgi:hypothetical protein